VKLSWGVGSGFYHAGQNDKAVEIYQKALESDPNFFMLHQGLGAAFEQMGRHQEAIAEFQKAVSLPGNAPRSKASLAHAFAVAGMKSEAEKIVADLEQRAKHEQISSFDFAIIAAGLGNFDRAFEYLERAYAEGDPSLNHLNVEPRLKSIRSDHRFQKLLQRMRLAS
jgi:adenylate cyclase